MGILYLLDNYVKIVSDDCLPIKMSQARTTGAKRYFSIFDFTSDKNVNSN